MSEADGAAQKGGLVLVAGAGPGLGAACLRRFGREGFKAVGLARTAPPELADLDIRPCDLTDAAACGETVAALIAEHGPPRAVIHNPSHRVVKPFLELTPAEFEASWRAMVLSAAHLAQACLPAMLAAAQEGGRDGGTLIFSGATASLRGGARFAALASPKFALRALAQSLAREFQSQGVHVVHVVLDGGIDTARSRARGAVDPEQMMKPAEIAEVYWTLSRQPRSVWTHELDLRPATERF